MAMIVVEGTTVLCSIDGGIANRVENLEEIERSIAGTLLRTQMSSTAGASKQNVTCRTIPYSTADRDTLIGVLQGAALLTITGDIGSFEAAAVINAIMPVTFSGGVRKWVITFDLVED